MSTEDAAAVLEPTASRSNVSGSSKQADSQPAPESAKPRPSDTAVTLEELDSVLVELDEETLRNILIHVTTQQPDCFQFALDFVTSSGGLLFDDGDAAFGSGQMSVTSAAFSTEDLLNIDQPALDDIFKGPTSPFRKQRSKATLHRNHVMRTKSWMKTHTCVVCEKPMRGLFRQGQQCTSCGTKAHHKCVPSLGDCTAPADGTSSANMSKQSSKQSLASSSSAH